MLQIVCFVVLLVFNSALAQSDCVPEPVQNLTLSLNYTLSWTPSLNCESTDYIVYVHSEFGLDHIYQVPSPSLEVSFLPACERYRFIVIAHSQNVGSEQDYIDAQIPAPPEADLTINHLNVTQTTNSIWLRWDVDEQYAHCAHYFRVVVVDYQIRDVYVENTELILLDDIVPCTEYLFSVRAIYNLEIEGPIAVVWHHTPAGITTSPSLKHVASGTTVVNITWGLPDYNLNRCPITSLVVDGSPYYNGAFPITDSSERPDYTVSLGPLRSESMYFFLVYIVNSAGNSAPYRIAVQTLPAN